MGRVDGEAAMQGHVLISPFPYLTFLIPPFLSHGRPSQTLMMNMFLTHLCETHLYESHRFPKVAWYPMIYGKSSVTMTSWPILKVSYEEVS